MKFVMKAMVYVVLMNAVLFAGAVFFDCDVEFNPIFHLVVPIICAYASWDVEQKKAKKAKD